MNLTSDNMEDIRRQGITVDDSNFPYPKNIPYKIPQPANALKCKPEGIICQRRSNNLHHTYAAFNNYSREEVTNMKKLELFLILCPVDYLKELPTHKINKLLKHPMDIGE